MINLFQNIHYKTLCLMDFITVGIMETTVFINIIEEICDMKQYGWKEKASLTRRLVMEKDPIVAAVKVMIGLQMERGINNDFQDVMLGKKEGVN